MALIRRLLLSAAVLACACFAPAAVAFDSNASGSTGGSSSMSWNHTCTGHNLVLVVGIGTNQSADVITGVTYDGVPLRKIGTAAFNGSRSVVQYALVGPAVGTHSIVVMASTSVAMGGVSQSFTGSNGVLNNQVSSTNSPNCFGIVASATGNMVCDAVNTNGISAFGDTNNMFVGVSGIGYIAAGSIAGSPSQYCGYSGVGGGPVLLAVNIVAGGQSKASGLATMGVG